MRLPLTLTASLLLSAAMMAQNSEPDFYIIPEVMPRIYTPECEAIEDPALRKKCTDSTFVQFRDANTRYPQAAYQRDSLIQGICVVSFLVNQEGKMEDIQLIRSLGEEFGVETLRVMEEMQKHWTWIPGTEKGKPVKVKWTIGVYFRYSLE